MVRLRRASGLLALTVAMVLAVAFQAAGATTTADLAVFLTGGPVAGPNLPFYPSGTTTVPGRTFGVGVRLRNAGPERAALKVRIELPPGIRWGNDAPDPSENCTSTETTGECDPGFAIEPTASFHPAGWAWDVVADREGSYTFRASVVQSSDSDPDLSNNSTALTVVVAAPPPSGSAAVSASRVTVAPRAPKAGATVRASVRVLAGGARITPTRVRCVGTVGGARIAGSARAAAGTATCVYRTPPTAAGKTLRGTISFRARTSSVTKRFSVKLR